MGKVIGITGGIASGKSTISNWLIEKGYPVVDADIAARKVVEPGEKALDEIKNTFGETIINSDGTLNREKLGAIVFNDRNKLQSLNNIVHPAVREWMMNQKERAFAKGAKIVFLDIPLLFESKLTYMVDQTILVFVDPLTQLARLKERNQYTDEEAQIRIQSQMPIEEKRHLADFIIDNTGSLENTKRQLDDILEQLHD